jgi:formylglycine-generating enzyme required for sulfatase activity
VSEPAALPESLKLACDGLPELEAARAGTTTATYLGNLRGTAPECTNAQANLDGIAWWCNNSGSRTKAVGGRTANVWGLYDMLGNVYEWTGDWYNAAYPGTVTDPTGPTAAAGRVHRGGSWEENARDARAAVRNSVPPAYRGDNLGFRLARTAP